MIKFIKKYKTICIITPIIVILTFNLFFKLFNLPSEGMANTYTAGSYILCYRTSDFERGDVVVHEFQDSLTPQTQKSNFFKRVVAIEGDIVIIYSGHLFINGELICPSHDASPLYRPFPSDTPVTIPKGKCFVLGDNYENSNDSRYFGLIETDTIHFRPVFQKQRVPSKTKLSP